MALERKKLTTQRFVISRLIEVVDARDRVIGAMPLSEAHRQSVLHRAVAVLAFFPGRRLFLFKRPAGALRYAGRFDVSCAGHVNMGESREETAWRLAGEKLPFRVDGLAEQGLVQASHHTGHAFISVFTARAATGALPPRPLLESLGTVVTAEEFALLLAEFRDLLTPGLVHMHECGRLFPDERH